MNGWLRARLRRQMNRLIDDIRYWYAIRGYSEWGYPALEHMWEDGLIEIVWVGNRSSIRITLKGLLFHAQEC